MDIIIMMHMSSQNTHLHLSNDFSGLLHSGCRSGRNVMVRYRLCIQLDNICTAHYPGSVAGTNGTITRKVLGLHLGRRWLKPEEDGWNWNLDTQTD